jgi:hypothetical protein
VEWGFSRLVDSNCTFSDFTRTAIHLNNENADLLWDLVDLGVLSRRRQLHAFPQANLIPNSLYRFQLNGAYGHGLQLKNNPKSEQGYIVITNSTAVVWSFQGEGRSLDTAIAYVWVDEDGFTRLVDSYVNIL